MLKSLSSAIKLSGRKNFKESQAEEGRDYRSPARNNIYIGTLDTDQSEDIEDEGGQLPREPFDIEQSSIHRRSKTSMISIGTASTKQVQRKLNLSEESAKILGYQESGNKAVRKIRGGDTGKKEDRQGSSGQIKLA